jgi:hypothetical protein
MLPVVQAGDAIALAQQVDLALQPAFCIASWSTSNGRIGSAD